MNTMHKRETPRFMIGDIAIFMASLWITLALRYFQVPSYDLFLSHLTPFALLFVVWGLIFFIAGLYDKPLFLLKRKLVSSLTRAHVANLIIASTFFYTVPYFGIAPKTTLFVYLIVSSALIYLWRMVLYPKLFSSRKVQAVLVGAGQEIDELYQKLNSTPGAGISFVRVVDPKILRDEAELSKLKIDLQDRGVSVLAVDLLHPDVQGLFSSFYEFIFNGIQFIDAQELYENVFNREPLGLIDESWILEHISIAPNVVYDALKRIMDITISLPLGVLSVILYPFVWLAIKLEDKGSIFIFQERIGAHNKVIKIVKFRTMTSVDNGMWVMDESQKGKREMRVTKVGKFLRKSRIDELPQLWNVIKGDISLIGPRPELPALVEHYNNEIPYYNVRHLIKPGLSGWAQIHHEVPPHTVEETKVKLSYDLYYIKYRSFFLDITIALKTIRTLLSRTGI